MSIDEVAFTAAVAALGIVSGATAAIIGFGIGSLLTPLLITRVDPHLAVSIIAVPHALATGVRYIQHRAAVDSHLLVRFGFPSAAGALGGAALQGALTSRGLLLVLGGLLIATGIANLSRAYRARNPPPLAAFALGALSGFFGGLAGNQGGFRTAGLSAFSLPPRTFLATGTAVALLVDLARTPVYLVRSGSQLNQFTGIILVASVGCVLGTIAGERVLLGMSAHRYRVVVGVAVLIVGVWLCVQGL
jgi:uncharacterized membrane protein YfcA